MEDQSYTPGTGVANLGKDDTFNLPELFINIFTEVASVYTNLRHANSMFETNKYAEISVPEVVADQEPFDLRTLKQTLNTLYNASVQVRDQAQEVYGCLELVGLTVENKINFVGIVLPDNEEDHTVNTFLKAINEELDYANFLLRLRCSVCVDEVPGTMPDIPVTRVIFRTQKVLKTVQALNQATLVLLADLKELTKD